MLKAAGFLTIRLCRSRIGGLSLDDLRLRAGEWCVVPPGPALAGLYRAAREAEGGKAAAYDSAIGQWVHMGKGTEAPSEAEPEAAGAACASARADGSCGSSAESESNASSR